MGSNGVFDGVDSNGVLLWIFDGLNPIGWTLVGFWIPHGWTLDFGFGLDWLVWWWWCGDGVVVGS